MTIKKLKLPTANVTSRLSKWATVRKNMSIPVNKESNQTQQFKKYVGLIQSVTPLLFPSVCKLQIDKHLAFLLRIYQSRGKLYLVRYLKATAESFDSLLLLTGESHSHKLVSIGLDSDGWPKWLGKDLKYRCLTKFSPTIDGLKSGLESTSQRFSERRQDGLKSGLTSTSIESIRYVQTLCSSRKAITILTKTDLSSITEHPTFEKDEHFEDLLDNLVKQVSLSDQRNIRSLEIGRDTYDARGDSPISYQVPKLQISLKSGPNGISIFNFPLDRAAILQNIPMKNKILEFAETYYHGDVSGWIDEKLTPYKVLLEDCSDIYNLGKLALIHSGGKLKPRVVGILDSFTQTLLGPFHDDLMSLLRGIPDDCTFDHDNISVTAKKLYSQGHRFYGFADLSNATDRIPKELYEVVGNELGEDLGTGWLGLFERKFLLGPSVKKYFNGTSVPDSVVYNTGQPMGALSSWPFMAYIHHVIVWYCFGGRRHARGQYKILGDDIVIFCENAYRKYLKTLDTLGISYTNCVSKVGFEFAKRTFVRGEEVTGAYTQALMSSMSTPELFTLEWKNLSTRGYEAGNHFPATLLRLLPLKKVNKRMVKRCRSLMAVPSGTNISSKAIALWTFEMLGRGTCHINSLGQTAFDEVSKSFKQLSALLIQRTFQRTLDESKKHSANNQVVFAEHFKKHWRMCNEKHTSAFIEGIKEYQENQTLKIRFLEKDLKNVFLKSNLRLLLRPNLLDIPRPLLMEKRDKHEARIKFQAKHHMAISKFFQIDRERTIDE